jgi:hypothetical protein
MVTNLILPRIITCRMRIGGQRATCTLGDPAAMGLAHGHHEGMEFVEEARPIPGGIGVEGPAGELSQGIVSPAIVAGRRLQ